MSVSLLLCALERAKRAKTGTRGWKGRKKGCGTRKLRTESLTSISDLWFSVLVYADIQSRVDPIVVIRDAVSSRLQSVLRVFLVVGDSSLFLFAM